MKKRFGTLVVALALVTACFGMSKTDQDLTNIQAELKLLETWIEAQQEFRDIPGIVVGLVYDQELIYSKGFGFADLEKKRPVTPETPFRIASMTKTFTATALMQLRDAGKLRLDDPVKTYLPWFNIKQRFEGQPPITIRQLLTHTSGLPREADFPYWTDHNFPSIDEIKATLGSQETIYPPAQEIKYSNLGMALAGEIVTAVSGMSYPEYIQQHIFEPLGMASSTVKPDAAYIAKLVTPYSHVQIDNTHKPEEYVDTEGITPAANIASTVHDLARYVSLQFRDEYYGDDAIVKGSTLKEMHRVQFLDPDWGDAWGLGWSVWQRKGKTVNGHGGWVGGNRTQIMFIPETKVGVIVLTNADDGEPSFLARHILDFAGPLLAKHYGEAEAAITYDPAWEKYVGTYAEPGPYYTEILILDQKLVMSTLSYPPEDDPDSEVITLTPEGPHTFRMTGENGNGELVIFQFDETKQIYQVKVGSNFIYPLNRFKE